MLHVCTHVGEREGLDGERSEAVAQVVEADPLQPGASERDMEAPPQRGVIEDAADGVGEDEVLLGDEKLSTTQAVERTRGREGVAARAGHDLIVLPDGRVSGTARLVQSEWGIKPYRGLMGALKVRDSLEVVFEGRLPAG